MQYAGLKFIDYSIILWIDILKKLAELFSQSILCRAYCLRSFQRYAQRDGVIRITQTFYAKSAFNGSIYLGTRFIFIKSAR
ncbi:hypothetical protein B5U78_10815 [Bifidobacterium longum]|nr:hypothetical protein CE166_10990 [Bifidobacterium longum]ROV51218.1 hypothetical protein B5U78_10815 [Bifidobacterium longum]